MNPSRSSLSRRQFVETVSTAAAASIAPAGGAQATAPRKSSGERLRIACIGIRGPGYGHLRELINSENIVALCDVGNTHLSHTLLQVSAHTAIGAAKVA